MPYLGLDIGTTSISAVVLSPEGGAPLYARTIPNAGGLPSARSYERTQDPLRIRSDCFALAAEAMAQTPGVRGVGLTGQMHGLLYLDASGAPCSPLYTWEDESGNELLPGGDATYAGALQALTHYPVASGFGCVTLHAHASQGKIPPGAAQICTIHDYIAMALCGLQRPVMHTSDAASFGLFDLHAQRFDAAAIQKAGLPAALFPAVTKQAQALGHYRGIPVHVAIGDNQASFLGAAAQPEESVLVNFGTGSQLSMTTPWLPPEEIAPGAELRPLGGDQFLYVGSALCGGRAWAALAAVPLSNQQDLRQDAKRDREAAYARLDALVRDLNPPPPGEALVVDTRFAGTRQNPGLRGGIQNLGLENFTPRHLAWGVLFGMAEELHQFYRASGLVRGRLIGAGNALRKNAALRLAVEQTFGLPLHIPPATEEAACGAARCAMGNFT
ncbi:MAG: hypothetical protein LBS96_01265 [Oscillospiraceae bacterium]|jgi:sedoheptulokinase|nr:hypothetical protein [Oscillospiraceae bacterium]